MPPTESRHYHWRGLEFYAQRGMITIIDQDMAADDTADPHRAIQRIRPGEFMKRAISIRQAVGDKYPDEASKANRLLEQATEICKIAKAQGDPGDPGVLEHLRKHKRRSSIITPGEINSILGPVGGPKYKIQMDDPRSMLLNGVQVTPDLTFDPAAAEQIRRAFSARR